MRLGWHEARSGERRGAYRGLVGNQRESDHLEDQSVYGKITLKWTFKNWEWTEFVWVRAGTTTISGLSSYRSDLFIRLLDQLYVLLQCNCDSLYVMMTYEGVKVQFHEFRSLILGGSEWAASRCSPLSPGKGVLLVLNF
jgi:hypothetical protein